MPRRRPTVGASGAVCPGVLTETSLVRPFLEERYGRILAVQRLPGGQWSEAFAFTTGQGAELVVRFGRHPEDYRKDRVAAGWSSPALPIPRVFDVGPAFDRHFAVSERVHGVALDRLDSSSLSRAVPAIFRALGAMREIALPGAGFGIWLAADCAAPFDSWPEFLGSVVVREDERVHGWRPALDAVPTAARVFDRAAVVLAELAGASLNVRGVVHEDLLAGNVLVEHDEVSGVLDWGNSLAGDPLYDVATMTFWAPWFAGLEEESIRRLAVERFADADFDSRVLVCELHTGLAGIQYNALVQRPSEMQAIAQRLDVVLARAR